MKTHCQQPLSADSGDRDDDLALGMPLFGLAVCRTFPRDKVIRTPNPCSGSV